MPPSIDQAARRRNAIRGACLATLKKLIASAVLLWLRRATSPTGSVWKLLLVLALLNLGMIIPIWISLKQRLQEIEGGEEDAAAQY